MLFKNKITEMQNEPTKEVIKKQFLEEYEYIVDQVLDNPDVLKGKDMNVENILEYYLSIIKIATKLEELYKASQPLPNISDITCEIQYFLYDKNQLM